MADTTKLPVLGKTTKADAPAELFAEDFHQSLVHETARADANSRRRGTASTLTRGEVSMTTAKAWRQKGTGRARVGALSVPNRYGGGAAFGPKPRHYTVKVNRKARRKAMRSKWGAKRSTLVIVLGDETGVLKSFRNIPRVNVMEVGAVGVVDVIGAASLVISEAALEVLAQRAGNATAPAEAPVATESTDEKGGE